MKVFIIETDSIIVDYNYKTNTGVLMIYQMYNRL